MHTTRITHLEAMGDWSGSVVSVDYSGTVIQWWMHSGEVIRQWNWPAGSCRIARVTRNGRFMVASMGNSR